jgi:GTPase
MSKPRSDIKDRKVIAEHDGDPAPELLAVKIIMPQAVWGWLSCVVRCRMAEPAAPTDTARDVVIPYGRGDLASYVHADGRVRQTEHIADVARIRARVPAALAAPGNDAGPPALRNCSTP